MNKEKVELAALPLAAGTPHSSPPKNACYINVDHPCYGVDVIETDNAEEIRALIGQGYVTLEWLRSLVAVATGDLLERYK